MASKLATKGGFRQSAGLVLGEHPHHHAREGLSHSTDLGPTSVDGPVDRGSPAAEKLGGRTSSRSEVKPRRRDLGHIGSRSASST